MLFSSLLTLLPLLAVASASPVKKSNDGGQEDLPKGTVFGDPSETVRRIHPLGRNDLCLGVTGGYPVDGTALGLILCVATDDKTYGNIDLWDVGDEDTSEIKLSGTDLCIDAGTPPTSGSFGHVKKCTGDSSQAIYHTGEKLIFTGIGQCLSIDPNSSPSLHPPYASYRDIVSQKCGTQDDPNQLMTFYTGGDEGKK